MKFLCDQMLGTLAKWLRLFGYDTFYANARINDIELIGIAKRENRVVLTRDKNFIHKAKKEKIDIIEITTTNLDDQLRQVLKDIVVNSGAVLSRCSLCNTVVQKIKKELVRNRVPHRVFENNERFWLCPTCDKIYWTGTHTDEIIRKLDHLKKITKN